MVLLDTVINIVKILVNVTLIRIFTPSILVKTSTITPPCCGNGKHPITLPSPPPPPQARKTMNISRRKHFHKSFPPTDFPTFRLITFIRLLINALWLCNANSPGWTNFIFHLYLATIIPQILKYKINICVWGAKDQEKDTHTYFVI